MSDIILKLKTLLIWHGSFRDWAREVWRVDPDSQICCNGHHCGCQGADHRTMWEWQWAHRYAT